MKSLIIAVCALLAPVAAYGQGTVQFNNRFVGVFDARVFLPDGITPVGAGFTAQLFAGPMGTPVNALKALTPTTTFRTGTAAGYVNSIDVTIPGILPGEKAVILMRVFNGSSFDTSTIFGSSNPIAVTVGNTNRPSNLVGLQSFALVGVAPPPLITLTRGLPRNSPSTAGSDLGQSKQTSCGKVSGSSKWFRVVSEVNGLATISTERGNSETFLALFAGRLSQPDSLTNIVCNRGESNIRNVIALQFRTQTNQDYLLAVDTGPSSQPLNLDYGFLGPRNADFNADMRGDIVLQRADGSVAFWLMNGTEIQSGMIPYMLPAGQRIVAVADFNSDDRPDLVLQHTDDTVEFRFMTGITMLPGAVKIALPPTWRIVATGDFNADGQTDIVLQNTDGSIAFWLMKGTTISRGIIPYKVPSGWNVVAADEFSGDGYTDIVFQHNDGTVAFWLMNDTSFVDAKWPYNVPVEWKIVATGDFDGDHNADIVLQHEDGSVAFWLMDGTRIKRGVVPFKISQPGWTILGPR